MTGGIPDRVLGRGSTISLFLVSVYIQQFEKSKKYFSFGAQHRFFFLPFVRYGVYIYIYVIPLLVLLSSPNLFFSLSTLILQREIYKEKASFSHIRKKPRRKPRLILFHFMHTYIHNVPAPLNPCIHQDTLLL